MSRTELAVTELAEMVARGREAAELADLGWRNAVELMAKRRRLILEEEIRSAPPLGLVDCCL